MEVAKSLTTFLFFNEKADKLERLSFTKEIIEGKSGVTISWKEGEELKAKRAGPDEESVDAFVLTLRFFTLSERVSR